VSPYPRNEAGKIWSLGVRTERGCLEWTGYALTGKRGLPYGRIRIAGRVVRVHRLAWELSNGPIPPGVFVCHKCDNSRCFEPSHLYLGDAASNMADKTMKGRARGGKLVGDRNPSSGNKRHRTVDGRFA